jgi:hypothetical protein
MKFKFLLLLTVLLTVTASGFSQEFDGVKIDGSKISFIKAMLAKGYTVKSDKGVWVKLKGNSSHPALELFAFFSPVTKQIWKLVVNLPEQTSWDDLKSQYNQYLDLLIAKYGEPANNYGFFSKPYIEGDGNEMTAVSLEKCTYTASWTNPEIRIEISKFKQVTVKYENPANSALDTRERDQVDRKTS